MHGGLEFAQSGAVVGEEDATVDVVAVVQEAFGHAGADEGDVAKGSGGVGSGRTTTCIVVAFKSIALALVGNAAVAHYEAVLYVSAVAVVGVEVIVPAFVGDEVFCIDRTAEPLEAVVVGVGHLYVVYLGSAAHRAEGDTVNLLVGFEGVAGKFHTHIAQHAGVVGSVRTAVLAARTAFDLCFAGIVGSLTADDQSAPVARFALSGGFARGEDDGCVGCTLCDQLTAALHDERRLCLLVATDDDTRFKGQFSAVGHVDPAFQVVRATGQGLLARKDEFLVAVADDVALEEQVVGCLQSAVGAPMALVGLCEGVVVTTCRKGERQSHCQQGRHAGLKKHLSHKFERIRM